MTTKVTIEPTGHYVLVTMIDSYRTIGGLNHHAMREEVMLPRERGGQPMVVYATTSRTYTIVNLEPDDPRAVEADGALNKA